VTNGPRRLSTAVRAQVADPLLRSAYSLMINSVVTAGLGIAFWIVAARLYEPVELGRDSALIAVMLELSVICQLNMVNGITRFLPSFERCTGRTLLGAYTLSGAAALVLGGFFVVIAPMTSSAFDFMKDWQFGGLYVAAQLLWGWFVLQDAALTAMRQAPWVPVENGVYGALKLAALPIFVAIGATHGIFLAWTLPILLLLVPVNLFLFRRAIPEHVSRQRPAGSAVLRRLGRRRLVRFMAQDWAASVLALMPTTVLPLLVVALLGAGANAYFYIPFTIVGSFNMLFFAMTTSLVVEGALAEDRIRALVGTIVRRFAYIVVPGTVVMIAAAPLILLPFGEDYVRESTPVLRLLACGCVFYAALALYVAIARLYGHGSRILVVEAAKAPLLLGGVVVLSGALGIEGVALAWLGSVAFVALGVLPSLMRFFRAPPMEVAALAPVPYPREHPRFP
jgi:O-antigen/teichoic acid export membrane protein